MAYNSYFPTGYQNFGYQQTYPQYQQIQNVQQQAQAQPQPQQMNTINTGSNIIWIQGGESAAKAYLCAPGQSVMLMDADTSTFFIKTVDQSGMPQPLRVFEYSEVTAGSTQAHEDHTQTKAPDYVTREEFESRIKAIEEREEVVAVG